MLKVDKSGENIDHIAYESLNEIFQNFLSPHIYVKDMSSIKTFASGTCSISVHLFFFPNLKYTVVLFPCFSNIVTFINQC